MRWRRKAREGGGWGGAGEEGRCGRGGVGDGWEECACGVWKEEAAVAAADAEAAVAAVAAAVAVAVAVGGRVNEVDEGRRAKAASGEVLGKRGGAAEEAGEICAGCGRKSRRQKQRQ